MLAATPVVRAASEPAEAVSPAEAVARRTVHFASTTWEGEVDGWVHPAREGVVPAFGGDRPSLCSEERAGGMI